MIMQAAIQSFNATGADSETDSARYARCIRASKRVRWDIDADVIRGRAFDFDDTFLPVGLSKVDQTALEPLVRFSDEELKHQELFRRIENMLDASMPAGTLPTPKTRGYAGSCWPPIAGSTSSRACNTRTSGACSPA
jgi:hypothetical protein